MTDDIRNFLVVYFADVGRVEIEDLGPDCERALQRYAEVEMEYLSRADVEVVLIGADSIEAIRRTYAHYFEREANGTSLRSELIARTGTDA